MSQVELTTADLDEFAAHGFVVIPGAVDESYLAAADAEIDRLAEESPPPPGTAGPHFWFLPPGRLPAARAALHDSGALALAEQLTRPLRLSLTLDHIQIALNIPPFPQRPGGPHIDGNVRFTPDQADPHSFTMLAGIFLSDETAVDSGNLWVWPGSHLAHQDHFRRHGPHALMDFDGHITMSVHAPRLAAPQPVLGRRGDLLLAHFLLGHNTGTNTSGTTRRMLYYRLGCEGHETRWQATFLDAFSEYAPISERRSG